jgi:putative transposase
MRHEEERFTVIPSAPFGILMSPTGYLPSLGQVLYVFLVLAHDRRRVIHFNVTQHPTSEWTGQQLRNAFPADPLPRYLLRDRDGIFGQQFREQVQDMGIAEVLSAPRSPWQRAYVERVIGSIRRECLDHVIVFDERSLRRILASYVDYYHRSRTHLSLGKDSPDPRVAVRQVGGLHHRYERRSAIEQLRGSGAGQIEAPGSLLTTFIPAKA